MSDKRAPSVGQEPGDSQSACLGAVELAHPNDPFAMAFRAREPPPLLLS
jgi:hypothetical protein